MLCCPGVSGTSLNHRSAAQGLVAALLSVGLTVLPLAGARAVDFRTGPVEGLFDLTLSYGMIYRTESRDEDFIAIANGGNAPTANLDDGNLNYDTGIVSNMVASTGELELNWGNVGFFTRGVAFYDYEQEKGDRPHREFDGETLDAIGSDAEIRDFFISTQFSWAGLPVQFRIGDQVINWGETNFIRDGVDIINPLDLVAAFQPARDARDTRIPQGMAWAVANVTETFAVEAYYQYDWEGLRLPAVGSFFSTNDLFGEGSLNFATVGRGQFSDLGTDLDAYYSLPEGTLGFDADFFKYPERFREYPRNAGQYGIAVQAITQGNNALKIGLHFLKYHSRLPLVGSLTASQSAINATTQSDVDAVAAGLLPIYVGSGLPIDEAQAVAQETAGDLVLNDYIGQAGYFTEYPEDIKMVGLTFNTATMRTGTLIAAEISHHMDYPFQIALDQVYDASLSPVQFDDSYKDNAIGVFGADARISGYERLDRTQGSVSAAQFFGRRLGASQSTLGVDAAFVYVHDLSDSATAPLQAAGGGDRTSWGYRVSGQLQYNSVFGGVNLFPRLVFAHDVSGYTPSPLSTFVEDRKFLSIGLQAEYIKRWIVDLSYTNFFDGEPSNPLVDRDYIKFKVSYGF
jgi:hypothetical protein